MTPRKPREARAFLDIARKRFKLAQDAEHKLREKWLEDMRFEQGQQWPEEVRRLREKDPANPRPCLTVNKTQLHVRQVCNDIRQNRPQIKVLPVDGVADIETAEIYSGLIRNIEAVSDADIAYDVAVKPQVTAGIGYFRIRTELIDAKLNLQDIRIDPIWNPLSVYMDPEIQHPAGADARWCFIVQDMSREALREKYPKAQLPDFGNSGRGDSTMASWYPGEDIVRVAEYYYLERELKRFYETEDGEVYDEDGYQKIGSPQPVKVREQYVNCCYWAKITGTEILEETKIPSAYIPVIRVAGNESLIDGERDVRGIVRDMRDPQRIYNYWVTLNTEVIALSPKSPYLVPFDAIEGHEQDWNRANVDNLPYLPYNHVDENGTPIPQPMRAAPPMQSTALVQAIMQADADLMGVVGRFEASIGEQGNEKSGRAIIARQKQGDNATFHFTDNLTRAIRHAGRILVDMIPQVYDTKRMLRVLGEDGSSDFAEVDPALPRPMVEERDLTGKARRIYNLGVGRYDVTCVAGPSYATKRQEAADMLTQLAQADPTLMQKAGDLIVRSFDLPGAEDLAKRLKAFLPPEVQQGEDEQDSAAQVAQAQEMGRQEVVAQVTPVIQQLQASLQEAAQEAAQQAQKIQSLEQQLADRASERDVRLQEAQLKAEAESGKAEMELVRVLLEKALTQAEQTEQPQSEPPAESSDMNGALAELQQQVAQLAEAVSRPKRKQIRVTEVDDQGVPVAAEVVEE